MTTRFSIIRSLFICILALSLCQCSPRPPFNNFQPEPPNLKRTATGAGIGALAGYLVSNTILGAAVGAGIGGGIGTAITLYRMNKRTIIKELNRQNIQFVEYGDTHMLLVPTDHYYEFNSPRLNELCFAGLNNIIRLLRFGKCSRVYVAGFTDNVGSKHHKNMLTQARAETMVAFLWAHGIPAKRLKAEGYGDKHSIGDNKLIHGSAYNRRIEIQWFTIPDKPDVDASMK